MQSANGGSWRFGVGTGSPLLRQALYIRDCLDLPVPVDDLVPPPLDGELPNRQSLVSANARAAIGNQWTRWWRQIVGQQFGCGPGRLANELALVEAPGQPEASGRFTALADQPQLREVVTALFQEAGQWRPAGSLSSATTRGNFDSEQLGRLADTAGARRGVDISDVEGQVVVMPVIGTWWRVVGPGQVLASQHAIADATVAAELAAAAFG
jgi:hypothetical protein